MVICSRLCRAMYASKPSRGRVSDVVDGSLWIAKWYGLKTEAIWARARSDFFFELDLALLDLFWDQEGGKIRRCVPQAELTELVTTRLGAQPQNHYKLNAEIESVWAFCGMTGTRDNRLCITDAAETLVSSIMGNPMRKRVWRARNRADRMVARLTKSSCWLSTGS